MWFDCPRMGQPWHEWINYIQRNFITWRLNIWLHKEGEIGFFPFDIWFDTQRGTTFAKYVDLTIQTVVMYGTGSGRSLDDSFTRSASFRRSKQVKAISNLIHGSSSGVKAMFRTTWTGSADELGRNRMSRSRSPSATPPTSGHSSPSPQRRETVKRHNHMYIETLLWQNFNMFYGATIWGKRSKNCRYLASL